MDYKSIVIKNLEKLSQKELVIGNKYKYLAYLKAINSINKLKKLRTVQEVNGLPGIGPKIKQKILCIIQTGILPSANHQHSELLSKLLKIHGIGPKTAKNLVYIHGITSISNLLQSGLLNRQQYLGLKYYKDLSKKIPRREIDLHKKFLSNIIPGSWEIAGSYSLGHTQSNDIDIIIKSNNLNILKVVIDSLKINHYIKETLSSGKKKFLGIVRLPQIGKVKYPYRRLDILVTNDTEYSFALLYFKYGKEFNKDLRLAAKKKGFRLNENGIINIASGHKLNLYTPEEIINFIRA
jgi:DNA polymerase/3'-5' exonuclease PolX